MLRNEMTANDIIPGAIQIISILTNIGLLGVGIKLVRHLTRIEFKVEMMWGVFVRRFGSRTGDDSDTNGIN
jgi:hypothetical protein